MMVNNLDENSQDNHVRSSSLFLGILEFKWNLHETLKMSGGKGKLMM